MLDSCLLAALGCRWGMLLLLGHLRGAYTRLVSVTKPSAYTVAQRELTNLTGKLATNEFNEISREVASLHTAIKEVSDEVQNPQSVLNRSCDSKKSELETILVNCRSALGSLDALLGKYRSLSSDRPRTLDRLRFGSKDLARIRGQLALNTNTIELFLVGLGTSSLGRIEERLDELVAEMRSGKRESTNIIIFGDNNEARDVHWLRLAAELRHGGMSSEDINAHQNGIRAYLQEQAEKYQLSIRSPPDKLLLPELERKSNPKIHTVKDDASFRLFAQNGNPDPSQLDRPPLSVNPHPPPDRPLPAIPSSNLRTLNQRPSPTSTPDVPPLPSSPVETWCGRAGNGPFETTTDVQEYDEQGQLRKRTITRHSSNSSLRSSLPSTRTSQTFGSAALQALADLKAEQEFMARSLESSQQPLRKAHHRATSSYGSGASLNPKSPTVNADAELECWKRRARLLKDTCAKQKEQIQAYRDLEANLRQSILETLRERDRYKQRLEEFETAQSPNQPCSHCKNDIDARSAKPTETHLNSPLNAVIQPFSQHMVPSTGKGNKMRSTQNSDIPLPTTLLREKVQNVSEQSVTLSVESRKTDWFNMSARDWVELTMSPWDADHKMYSSNEDSKLIDNII